MSIRDFDLRDVQSSGGGLDAFFETEASLVTPLAESRGPLHMPAQKVATVQPMRMRVASLQDLNGFVRTAEDQLVNKATQDLWSLQKDADGDFYIARMFDETSTPLKG